jgi:leader peptidase (prepilin peptidase)/N-methyltransferase
MGFSLGFSFFIFGAIIGSFLNVVILRYNTGRGVNGRSGCFSCGATLQWYELVPIVSFLALRGRCRTCHTKLSWQYPLVECATGFVFVALSQIGLSVGEFMVMAGIFATLVVIFVYDLRHKIIPDGVALALALLSLVKIIFFSSLLGKSLFFALLAGPLMALPFALLWLVSRGAWIGFGDAKLAWGIGWFLGPVYALSGLVIGFWIGAFVSIFLLSLAHLQKITFFKNLRLSSSSKNLTMKSEIPLGPFLILGAILVFFFPIDLFSLSLIF